MMYSFVDVNASAKESDLPAEAMKYNGVYLENEIPGYRTLHVSGRELMGADVQEEEIGLLDGAKYYGKKYQTRTITVTYQLIASSDTAFRAAYNKMNALLSGEQVQIIFNDEPDKYFIGTKTGNTDPSPGKNSITGEIEIHCADPKKYSTVLKEFQAEENEDGVLEVTIENEGTLSATIDYEVNNIEETGYFSVVAEAGAMQFGKIEEADGEEYKQNEMLATLQNFINAPDDVNGIEVMHPEYGTEGSLATHTWFSTTFLGFGTPGNTSKKMNGGMRTLTLPADSEGVKGAKNWYSYFHVLFYAGRMGQTGELTITWLTDDNKMIAGVNWYKSDTVGNTGKYELWANGKKLRTYSYTTSHLHSQNPWYWNWGHCDLKKEGSKLTFYYWGSYPSYIIPEIEDLVCTKIQVSVKQYGNRGGTQFMTYAGIDELNFQKIGVEKWRDVPNRYPAGSILKIDGNESKFYVNEMLKQDDEILGTSYFKAPPGEMNVQFGVSTWVTQKPEVKARIREAWL